MKKYAVLLVLVAAMVIAFAMVISAEEPCSISDSGSVSEIELNIDGDMIFSLVMPDGSILAPIKLTVGTDIDNDGVAQRAAVTWVDMTATWNGGRPLPTSIDFLAHRPTGIYAGPIFRVEYTHLGGVSYRIRFSGWIPRVSTQ